MRLHRDGRFRSWLGHRLGGGPELGDRIWRRCLHGAGAAVLVYYLLPVDFFRIIPNWAVLLAALGVVLLLEALRWTAGVELPTIRPHERERIASFAYFALGLVAAVLLFPKAIAVAVVLGTALVDPMIGEIRHRPAAHRLYPSLPLAAYGVMGFAAFRWVGVWSFAAAVVGAIAAALIAVGVERVRAQHLDDDLTMTIVPGALLTIVVVVVPWTTAFGP